MAKVIDLAPKREQVNAEETNSASYYLSEAVDDSDAIQRAVNASTKKVIIPDIGRDWVLPNVVMLNKPNLEIEIVGTVKIANSTIKTLVSDALVGSTTVTLSNVDGLREGFWVTVVDDNSGIQGGGGHQTRKIGDTRIITAINGNTVTLNAPLNYPMTVAANAKIGTQNNAFLIDGVPGVKIFGSGKIDGNKANQLDVEPIDAETKEEPRAGCGITAYYAIGTTIEGITVVNSILHNVTMRSSPYSHVIKNELDGAHDKNILSWSSPYNTYAFNACKNAEYEDGITLYSGDSYCLVEGNVLENNARIGLSTGPLSSGVSSANNLAINNRINYSLKSAKYNSVGDRSVGGKDYSAVLGGHHATIDSLKADGGEGYGNVMVCGKDMWISNLFSMNTKTSVSSGRGITIGTISGESPERVRLTNAYAKNNKVGIFVDGTALKIELIRTKYFENTADISVAAGNEANVSEIESSSWA